MKDGQKYYLVHLKPLNSGRGEGEVSFTKFSQKTKNNIEEIKKTKGFAIAERNLLRQYSHFLSRAKIR